MSTPPPIQPYERRPAVVREHDPRAFAAVARLVELITAARPGTVVEHIGSSAVAGLPGKGVLDLLVAAGPGELPDIVESLLGLGFQHQTGPDPFPPERPLLQGAIDHDGERFRIHAHVVPADAPEAGELIGFRDALRADPALAAAYAAEKYRVAEAVGWDKGAYSLAKGPFVERVLAALRAGVHVRMDPPAA